MTTAETRARQVAATKRWAARNPDRLRANWRVQGLRRYGLTPEEYDLMLVLQDGLCAICHRPPTDIKLAVDHDHETGTVRGLLCPSCNNGLGRFRDDPALLTRAADYLKGWPCTNPF
jgi:hypothetical protein